MEGRGIDCYILAEGPKFTCGIICDHPHNIIEEIAIEANSGVGVL
jgi:hypothetical protein